MSLLKNVPKLRILKKSHFLISFQPTVPIATKLCRMVTYLDGPLPLKSIDHLITWSCKVTWQTKIIISLLPQRFWPPNLAGWLTLMASCLKSLIKPLITLSCEITWQTKIIVSSLPQCLWPPDVARWQFTLISSCP